MNDERSSSFWLWFLAIINGLIVLGIIFSAGCLDIDDDGEEGIPGDTKLSPEVKFSDVVYMNSNVPYDDIHRRSAENYSGSDLTVEHPF